MATTRIIPMHINKGKTIAQCLKARVDYVKNPDKTEGGALISAYACSPETADQEFLLARSEYMAITGRKIHNEVIAYQLRQSFKPGEVTPEEANKIGYELASQFLKGEHAFIVATHNDRRHVHNHIVFCATALDGSRKFRNVFRSDKVLAELSDQLCEKHRLSAVICSVYGFGNAITLNDFHAQCHVQSSPVYKHRVGKEINEARWYNSSCS